MVLIFRLSESLAHEEVITFYKRNVKKKVNSKSIVFLADLSTEKQFCGCKTVTVTEQMVPYHKDQILVDMGMCR